VGTEEPRQAETDRHTDREIETNRDIHTDRDKGRDTTKKQRWEKTGVAEKGLEFLKRVHFITLSGK